MRWIFFIVIMLALSTTAFSINTAPIVVHVANFTNGSTQAVGNYAGPLNNSLTLTPPPDEVWYIARMIVEIGDSGTLDSGAYGNNIVLTNGITVELVNGTSIPEELTHDGVITHNSDWASYAYDTKIIDFGTGDDIIVVRWTFSRSGTTIKLDGSKNESIGILFNDDFSGLDEHRFVFQGFKGEPTPEKDMSAFLAIMLPLTAILVLLGVGILKTKNIYSKLLLSCVSALVLILTSFYSIMFFDINYPSQEGVKRVLEMTYGLFTYAIAPLLLITAAIISILFIRNIFYKKKKENNLDW